MATSKSKYQNDRVDALLNDLITVLESHKAPTDLSLMALGNTVSNILNNSVSNPAKREALAEAFGNALKNAVKNA